MTTIDLISRLLRGNGEEERFRLLSEFVRSDTGAAVTAAKELLNSTVADERRLGADLLGQAATVDHEAAASEAEILLSTLGREQNADALQAVIVALGHLGDKRARTGIARYKDHPDAEIRFAVAWSLPSVGLDENTIAALRDLSGDADEDVRDWATFGLAESDSDDPLTREALWARTDDLHDDTRAEAIYGLARRHDPRATVLVHRELSLDTHGSLIDEALKELG